MFSKAGRLRLYLSLVILGVSTLFGVLSGALTESNRTCRTEEVASINELLAAGTGGLLYDGRFLRSNCYMVVFFLSPDPPPDAWSGYHRFLEVDVQIIGRGHPGETSRRVYTLVRYRLAESCEEAVEIARNFVRQMADQGLRTPSTSNFDNVARFCPAET